MESTKHFKRNEDWERQRDDVGDREGAAAHEKKQGKKNIPRNYAPERERRHSQKKEGKLNTLHAEVIIFFLSLSHRISTSYFFTFVLCEN